MRLEIYNIRGLKNKKEESINQEFVKIGFEMLEKNKAQKTEESI